MANASIKAAFERMWQHTIAAIGNKDEIGSVKDTFSVDSDVWQLNINEDSSGTISKAYELYFNEYTFDTRELLGKTLVVKTYAYSTMGYRFIIDGLEGDTVIINQDANITENPESGVCEFTVTIPEKTWEEEFSLIVDFADNPYIDMVEAYEKRGTVWSEIKTLSENTIISSGNTTIDGVDWYYRKWGNGFAECWAWFGCEGNVYEEHEGVSTVGVDIVLPFEFAYEYDDGQFCLPNIFLSLEVACVEYDDVVGYEKYLGSKSIVYAKYSNGLAEVVLKMPSTTPPSVGGSVYVTGYWKTPERSGKL